MPTEFILTWPTAFAIVGSVVSIVVGLFGYLKAVNKPANGTPVRPVTEEQQTVVALNHIGERLTTLETKTLQQDRQDVELQGDLRVLREVVNNLLAQVNEHERRDIADFRLVNEKVEKLQDVLIRLLQDDKL